MWAGAGDLGTGCHGGGGGGRRDCSRQPQLLKLSASPAAAPASISCTPPAAF